MNINEDIAASSAVRSAANPAANSTKTEDEKSTEPAYIIEPLDASEPLDTLNPLDTTEPSDIEIEDIISVIKFIQYENDDKNKKSNRCIHWYNYTDSRLIDLVSNDRKIASGNINVFIDAVHSVDDVETTPEMKQNKLDKLIKNNRKIIDKVTTNFMNAQQLELTDCSKKFIETYKYFRDIYKNNNLKSATFVDKSFVEYMIKLFINNNLANTNNTAITLLDNKQTLLSAGKNSIYYMEWLKHKNISLEIQDVYSKYVEYGNQFFNSYKLLTYCNLLRKPSEKMPKIYTNLLIMDFNLISQKYLENDVQNILGFLYLTCIMVPQSVSYEITDYANNLIYKNMDMVKLPDGSMYTLTGSDIFDNFVEESFRNELC